MTPYDLTLFYCDDLLQLSLGGRVPSKTPWTDKPASNPFFEVDPNMSKRS